MVVVSIPRIEKEIEMCLRVWDHHDRTHYALSSHPLMPYWPELSPERADLMFSGD